MAAVMKKKGSLSKKKTSSAAPEENDSTLFEFPSAPSVPSDDLRDYSILLFGEKKIGKTSLLAETPGAFFAMFEPGGKALAIHQHLFKKWTDFKLMVAGVSKQKQIKNVILDPVDLCYKLCEKHVLRKLGIDHPSDEGYGKGWAAIRDEWTDVIQRLLNSGKGVIFVAHATEKEIKRRDGATYDRIMPVMPGICRDVIEGFVDIWCYACYEGNERVITLLGDDHVAAGHRLAKHFRTADGKPLREISMGSNPAEAWKNFTDAFHNRYVPTVVAPPTEKRSVVKKKAKK